MSIPVIDFAAFRHGTKEERASLADRVTAELKKHGATKLINHGVTAQMIEECYKWSKRFFELPAAEKAAIPNERNADPQRGWSYVGSEKTSKLNKLTQSGRYDIAEDESVPQDLEDVKEHFDFVQDGDTEFPSKWPEEAVLPGFRKFMVDTLLEPCQEAARDVLTCLEMGLGLDEGVFTKCMETRVDELRINYYPPLPLEKLTEGKHQRVWPHTDFGFVTLLFQDALGGLEIENREKPGTWIPVNLESPTEMGVYISDTMAHMTNDYLRSGVHQVVAPTSIKESGEGVLGERYSFALFAKADRGVNVGSLEKYITEENPRRYENLTGFDLHSKRVGQLYGAHSAAKSAA